MRNIQKKLTNGISVVLLLISVFTLASNGQGMPGGKGGVGLIEDTAKNPHEFNDATYEQYGVDFSLIIDRRTGSDGWSLVSYSSDPTHSPVRVTATLPAYDQNGRPVYWYPLGDLTDSGFTPTDAGDKMRQTARRSPIYVFPDGDNIDPLTKVRQASVMDNSWQMARSRDTSPLLGGVRQIFVVNYTAAAFSRGAQAIMDDLADKNGLATDKTPIIRTVDEIKMLFTLGYITFDDGRRRLERPSQNMYRIAPVIADPASGIALDAFLIMPMVDGRVLDAEEQFVKQFECYRDGGGRCSR